MRLTKAKFKEVIRKIIEDLKQEDLEEITTTGDVDGYSTPNAFVKKKKKKKSGYDGGHREPDVFGFRKV